MRITVLYFASLRQTLGKARESVELPSAVSASELWRQVAAGHGEQRVLVAINQHYVDWSQTVSNGDEVAFFPPVTGG